MNIIIAALLADIHLSHNPPVARSAEPNWYSAMQRQLCQLQAICQEYKVPAIIAGDVFDDGWRPHRCPPELTSFAMKYLPEKVYAIFGQHDLPHHRLEDKKRSALWTLVQAGRVILIPPNKPIEVIGHAPIRLYGFSWGVPIKPLQEPHDLALDVAIIHSFIWTKETGYYGALEDKTLQAYRDKLTGYDVAVFGDNHKPFTFNNRGKNNRDCKVVYNCGGFFRRRIDEKKHKPSIGLLYSDGSVRRYYLDVSQDKFLDIEENAHTSKGYSEGFIKELNNLSDQGLDFSAAVRQVASDSKIKQGVRDEMLLSLEGNT